MKSHKVKIVLEGNNAIHGSLVGEGRAPRALFDAQRSAFKNVGARWSGSAWVAERSKLSALVESLSEAEIVTVLPEALANEVNAANDNADRAPVLPEGFSLFAHQKEGLAWLRHRAKRGKGALLADDMGLGKTAQTLLSLDDSAPVLVIAPAVAKGVWVRETALWRPDYRALALSGRGSFRWPAPGEVVVTNFDILPKVAKGSRFPELPAELAKGAPANLKVIVDEAHKVKNPKAQRTQSLRALCALSRAKGGDTVLLTGTPVLNNPKEAWTILVAANLHREAFPGGWSEFASLAGGVQGRFGMEWDPARVQTAALAERLAKVQLRRRKDDVLDLPGKMHERIVVDIPRVAAADKALKEAGDIDLSKADLAALGREISFATMSKARAALAKAKIKAAEAFVDDLEEAGEGPLVVFSAHVGPVEHFAKREGWAKITGDITSDERTKIEEDFQAGKIKGIAATIRSTGVALTLTAAARVVFIDEDWTPGNNEQAEDRCYRIGQTRSVVVTTLVADHPLDERIADLLARKNEFVARSTEAAADAFTSVPAGPALLVEIERPAPAEAAPAERAEATPAVPFTDVERAMPQPRVAGNGNGAPDPVTPEVISSYEDLRSTQVLATHCHRCRRPLRDSVSQEIGIGPKCRERLGVDVEVGLAEGRAEANVIIWAMLDAPTDRRLDADRGCDRLAELGFGNAAALRERIRAVLDDEAKDLAARPVKVRVTVNKNRDWVVVTPFKRDAVDAFRAIKGRRWSGAEQANIIPRAEGAALHDLLKAHWAGEMCEGARGQRFVL